MRVSSSRRSFQRMGCGVVTPGKTAAAVIITKAGATGLGLLWNRFIGKAEGVLGAGEGAAAADLDMWAVHEADSEGFVTAIGNDAKILRSVERAIKGTEANYISVVGHGIDGVGRPLDISSEGPRAAVRNAKFMLAARGVEATRVNLVMCFGGCSTGIAKPLFLETGLTVRAALGVTSFAQANGIRVAAFSSPKFQSIILIEG